MVAQAFLLTVLTNEDIASYARLVILIAGVLATLAAVTSMLRLRAREEHYSEAIAFYARKYGIKDPRPFTLKRDKPANGLLRAANGWAWPPIHYSWTLALLAFVAADIVAFCVSL